MVLAQTPDPPYYAVIFTSVRAGADGDADGYEHAAARMFALADEQPGFLGVDTAREDVGITVSYWTDREAAAAWKRNAEHLVVQAEGRARWYEQYEVRVARVEEAYGA